MATAANQDENKEKKVKKLSKKIIKLAPDIIKNKIKKLKGERGTWETHWQEINDHVNPRKNTIQTTKSPGQKRTWQLLDNTGMHSNEMLAGALHGLLTNPDLPWFEFTTGNLLTDNLDSVRKWMQATARDVHNVLNNSNFQTELHELYTDLTSIATGCMLIEEDERFIVRFSTKFIADYFIAENNLGFIDQVYREWKWDAVQIIAEFELENVPEKVRKAYEKNSEEKFTIIHGVYPKTLVDPKYEGDMKYVSQYILADTCEEISVGEYQEFPYVVPRWTKSPGEVYGRGPAMTALPELKVLNKMNETMLIGAQKLVDPPVELPDDGFILPIITKPGGINYRRSGNPEDRIRPIFNDTRIDFGYQAMGDIRKRVRDAFYVDQLKLAQDAKYMTATEVLQRTEESMRLLGPMLGRMQSEFLRPLVDRVFRIMWDRKKIAQPPPELEGMKIDVRYNSMIAKSQRVNEGQSILRVVQGAAPFMQLDPSVGMNFDGDAVIRILVATYGAPQEMLRDEKDVAQMRKAQADAQKAAAQQQQQQGQISDSLNFVKAAKEAQGL